MSRHTDQHSASSASSPTNLMTPSPTLSFTTLSAAHQHAFMNSARVQASQPNAQQAANPAQARPAQNQQTAAANTAGSKVKTAKSRKRVNTAEKRATHNAVERQRREALNGRFLDLARLLPGLASVRRPSKSNIVNNSISHLSAQRGYRLSAARELRTLLAERDALLSEVNDWRSRNGVEARESTGMTAAIEGVLKVEEETFGVFTAGFGPDDGEDDDEGADGEGSFDGGASVSAVMDRTSFSSDVSNATGSTFNQAYNAHQAFNGTSAAAAAVASNLSHHMNGTFFGESHANVKTEAISPASDSSSPLSSAAHGGYHVEGSSPHDTEKVTSWAAEQLLAHLRHQQKQAEDEQLAQHRDRSDSVGSHHSIPLANAHHGSNPFTANLLATIAAQQQRSSFDMGTNFANEDSPKSYSYPPGPSHLGYPGFLQQAQHQQHQQQQQQQPAHASLDAWRSYALAQYQQQPAAFQQQHHAQGGRGEPSLDDITAAVRVGMGYGLGMTLGGPASQQTSLWGMTPEAESFSA